MTPTDGAPVATPHTESYTVAPTHEAPVMVDSLSAPQPPVESGETAVVEDAVEPTEEIQESATYPALHAEVVSHPPVEQLVEQPVEQPAEIVSAPIEESHPLPSTTVEVKITPPEEIQPKPATRPLPPIRSADGIYRAKRDSVLAAQLENLVAQERSR